MAASLKARGQAAGELMLSQLRTEQDVEVLWTDSEGEQDWWDAQVLEARHTAYGGKNPGIKVAFLDKRRQIHTDSKRKFLTVPQLPDRLRIPGAIVQSGADGEENPLPSPGMSPCYTARYLQVIVRASSTY